MNMFCIFQCSHQVWNLESEFVPIISHSLPTFSASPKAPGKELLSRTTNVPGGLSFNILMAENRKRSSIKCEKRSLKGDYIYLY